MTAMIGGLIGWLGGSRWALAAAEWGTVGLTVLLFLLSVGCAGERAGRMAQRLETMEKSNDVQPVLVTSWLGGCAMGGSEPAVVAVCAPVIEYSAELWARAAEDLELLPEGSAIIEMLGDYAVMREQVRACQNE